MKAGVWQSRVATCFHTNFLLGFFFDYEDGGGIPPKCWLTFIGLYDVLYQK
jgi:hypothetical protein